MLVTGIGFAFVDPALADHPAAGFGHGITGPIVTIPAETLPRGRWAVGARLELVSFDPFSDEELGSAALAGEDVHSTDNLLSPSVAVGYGVTDHLTIGVRLPYVIRSAIREAHLEDGSPEVHNHGDSEGIGDLTLLGQYQFVRGAGGTEAALLVGVKLPIGRTKAAAEDGETFDIEHQPGSGSTDPLIGLAGSKPWERASLDANLLATLTTEGSQETNLGTLLNYNIAVSLRPGSEHEHEHAHSEPAHDHTAFDLVLEANGEWRGRMDVAGNGEENSGGHLIYISPGARLSHGGRWSLSGSVGFPVLQESNGTQHETDLRILIGMGVAF